MVMPRGGASLRAPRSILDSRPASQVLTGDCVGELAKLCGYSSANISRHLALLMQRGLVARESRGNSAMYTIADESVYALCDLVCGSIARQFERTAQEHAAFALPTTKRPRARAKA